MRISQLAEVTGVPVPTVKFYLREGLLMPGAVTGPTRAVYAEEHVARVRLVRALTESAGLSLAAVREVLETLQHPPRSRHDLLGAAQCALPAPGREHEVSVEVREVVESLGWRVAPDTPLLGSLTASVEAARSAGVHLDGRGLRHYAEAVRRVAEIDYAAAARATTVEEAIHLVTVGTAMLDPVLAMLRRLAQEAVSADHEPAAT
ncbi:MAG TPA: MerR family transcriptional regulator [Dermatophilaceae bacterium]|nr:MerR family transcriptional regulator [Dermatophilaceae bacterium]